MIITDLSPEDQERIHQTARLLVEGFKTHWPKAWPDLKSALEEVQESFESGRISRVALGDNSVVLGWIGAIPEYDGHA